jgi:hypothetical protein
LKVRQHNNSNLHCLMFSSATAAPGSTNDYFSIAVLRFIGICAGREPFPSNYDRKNCVT